jgi:hypothetical protein
MIEGTPLALPALLLRNADKMPKGRQVTISASDETLNFPPGA